MHWFLRIVGSWPTTVCFIRHHICIAVMIIQHGGKVKLALEVVATHVELYCRFVLSNGDWHAFLCDLGFAFVKFARTRLLYFIQINYLEY
jgi:hypothetical protein